MTNDNWQNPKALNEQFWLVLGLMRLELLTHITNKVKRKTCSNIKLSTVNVNQRIWKGYWLVRYTDYEVSGTLFGQWEIRVVATDSQTYP